MEVTLTGPEGKPGHIPSGPFFTSIAVDVEGFVPRIDQEGFERVSRVAVDRCMQGLHINDDLHVTVQAELLGA